MKTILLSSLFAVGLGLAATAPSSAAPISVQSIKGPSLTENVACRTVTKRVRRANGAVRVTKSRVCTRPAYRGRSVYRDNRWRRAPSPGLTIRVR